MKTARPWTGHIGDQWGGMDHDALARDGWLDADGWPNAMPPGISGIATLVLTDLPYFIAYRVKSDQVQILRVLHTARKWPLQ